MINKTELDQFYRQSRRYIHGAGWRWNRARIKAYTDKQWTPSNDETISMLTAFLMFEDGHATDSDIESIEPVRYAEWSRRFRSARSIMNSRIDRIIVESMMLARFSNDAIASQTGIPTDVLEVYEACYFDVRDILDARDAILASAVDSAPGSSDDSMRTEVLKLSYFGGAVASMACIDYLQHLGEPKDLATELGMQRQQIDLMVKAGGSRWDPWVQLDFRAQAAFEQTCEMNSDLPTISSLIVDRFLAYGRSSLPNAESISECYPGDDVGPTTESATSAA